MSLTHVHRYDGWTHRFALLAMACAVPLVLFGGSVTTLGAGMAVDGWLIAEGHFLVLFPLESWTRDVPTFVEHTHRLFGVLVGLVAAAACVRAWWVSRGGLAFVATAALLAVCAQGALGGLRVLENSPNLAFLHGVFAQITFAVLVLCALLASRRWNEGGRSLTPGTPALAVAAVAATALVLAQVSLGAWYRHALRPEALAGAQTRLALHIIGAVAVFLAAAWLASACRRAAGGGDSPGAQALCQGARRLHLLLGVQVLLGMMAWASHRPGALGPMEWGLSILHVLGGALLLAQCASLLAWSMRRGAQDVVAAPALEAAV